MKKITSLLCFSIALLSSFSVFSQFSFPVDAGPYTVGGGTPVTVNVNDVGNSGGVTAGLYDSFTITVNWADENFAWSSEADLTVITSAGSVLIDPPTSGGGFSNATTLTFSSYFTDVYDPSVDGSLDIVMNQSYSGSSAIWTNILVTLNEQPACPSPLNLLADNITSSSADLSWTQSGSSTSWNIEVVSAGTTPTGTPTETGVTNPHTVTGLVPVTGYNFYVQADCGTDGLSEWSGPFSFTTSCDVYVPDYLEDFTVIPADCWEEADAGNPTTGPLNLGGGSWTADGYLNNGTTGAFKINLYSSSKSDWILSPQIDLTGGPFQVEFDFGVMKWGSSVNAGTLGSDDQVQFLMSTDNGVTWTALISWDNTSVFTASGAHYVFDLSAYNGVAQFGVWASEGTVSDPVDVDVFFDNFRVRAIPTCPEPSQLEASNIGPNSAQLSWTQTGSSTSWNIEVVPTGTTPTGTPTETGVSNPHTVTGLTSVTGYDFYVQADCGTDGLSEWVGPLSFTTSCDVYVPDYLEDFTVIPADCWNEADDGNPTTGPLNIGSGSWTADGYLNNGNTGAFKINLYSSSKSDWILSPQIDLTGGPFQVEFDFGVMKWGSSVNAGTLGSDDQVQFLMSTDNGVTWTALISWDNTSVFTASGAHYVFDLSAYNGVAQFGVWASEGTVSDPVDVDVFFDNFRVRAIPTCPEPSQLEASNIGPNSAQLSWTQTGSSTSWNIEVVPTGTTPTGTPTETGVSNPHTVTGLTSVTGYDFYVQADCGTDGLSEWVGPLSFTTSCDVYVPDYLEDFTVIPADCWNEADDGNPTTGPLNIGSGSWTADGYLNNGNTGAFKINLYSTGKSDWILSPQIDLTGGPFQVEFDFGVMVFGSSVNAGSLGSDDQVQFLMSTDNGVTWTALISWDNTSVFSASGSHYVFDLTAFSGDTVQFGVWASEGAVNDPSDVDVFFDNFRVRSIPTCPDPSQLEVLGVGTTTAELTWLQSGAASTWNIEYGPAGFDLTDRK